MDFTVSKLTPEIGAEIRGLDLREPLDDETLAQVRQVWLDHVIVLFPEQEIDDGQQIEFSRRIGELELINMAALQMRGKPEIYRATNLNDDDTLMAEDHPIMQTNRDNQRWHTDSSFKRIPAMASALHARIVPDSGGETEFANTAAAYDALDDDTKKRIEDLVVVHNFFWSRRDAQEVAFTEEEKAAIPPVRHPLARIHPETGRRAIYAGSHAEQIEGMSWEESRDLIDRLNDHATQARFTYRHDWKVGDMVLWDNRAALHRGLAFDAAHQRRRLHRTTVAGTAPTL